MGTRGAWGWRFHDKDYLFYNHFDSYPSGLGHDIVTYIREHLVSEDDVETTKQKLRTFKFIEDDMIVPDYVKTLATKLGTVDLSVSNRNLDDWYCITRRTQGNPLLTLELGHGENAEDFLRDSLFCEYAYIINLDTNMLEIYQGFNKDARALGRYAALTEPDHVGYNDDYRGVALIKEYPLFNIPRNWENEIKELTEEKET